MASQRKSYTVHFKLQALKKLEDNGGNVSATAQELDIHQKQLQAWRKQKQSLLKYSRNRHIDTKKKRYMRKGISKYPLVDTAIMLMIQERRKCAKSVTKKIIQKTLDACFVNCILT